MYDDDIIEEVCQNMGTIMFQLGALLEGVITVRRAAQETCRPGGGPHGHGSLHQLRLLQVVQARGKRSHGLQIPHRSSRVP